MGEVCGGKVWLIPVGLVVIVAYFAGYALEVELAMSFADEMQTTGWFKRISWLLIVAITAEIGIILLWLGFLSALNTEKACGSPVAEPLVLVPILVAFAPVYYARYYKGLFSALTVIVVGLGEWVGFALSILPGLKANDHPHIALLLDEANGFILALVAAGVVLSLEFRRDALREPVLTRKVEKVAKACWDWRRRLKPRCSPGQLAGLRWPARLAGRGVLGLVRCTLSLALGAVRRVRLAIKGIMDGLAWADGRLAQVQTALRNARGIMGDGLDGNRN